MVRDAARDVAAVGVWRGVAAGLVTAAALCWLFVAADFCQGASMEVALHRGVTAYSAEQCILAWQYWLHLWQAWRTGGKGRCRWLAANNND